jgi:hypothetical protein
MRNTIIILFILSLCSCSRKSIHKDAISDCQLASLIINQIDILDDHKGINEYMILIDSGFVLSSTRRLSTDSLLRVHNFNFGSCNDFKIKNKQVEFYSENPCSDAYKNKESNAGKRERRSCRTIEISNLFVFKNEYVIRISINDTGFYAGSFRFKMDNYKLYDIAMDDYTGNFQHPGTKNLFLKYPMIKK